MQLNVGQWKRRMQWKYLRWIQGVIPRDNIRNEEISKSVNSSANNNFYLMKEEGIPKSRYMDTIRRDIKKNGRQHYWQQWLDNGSFQGDRLMWKRWEGEKKCIYRVKSRVHDALVKLQSSNSAEEMCHLWTRSIPMLIHRTLHQL